jgi:hypothetical protein
MKFADTETKPVIFAAISIKKIWFRLVPNMFGLLSVNIVE